MVGEGVRVLLLSWRDTTHPQGGGSEVYAERVAAGLSGRGHQVTMFCAAHRGAPSEETTRDEVRIVRGGGELSVYPHAALSYASGRLGRADVVVDVQNGIPFAARAWFPGPVVLLCHHVHREQWPVVRGPLGARMGWAVESRLSPWLNRGTPYVTVSRASAAELVSLGVDPAAVTVIHNGTDEPPPVRHARSMTPLLCVLGRLVPHKRVEVAIDVVAALRTRHPGLRLAVVGRGWWEDELREHAARRGLGPDVVEFTGWVDERTKHAWLERAWVSLVPSLKEGWGLAVVEAAAHGVPSVAFAGAGGVAESVLHGRTGLLADDVEGFTAHVARLLDDGELRRRFGSAARAHAAHYTWSETVDQWESLLLRTVGRRPLRAESYRFTP